MIVIVVPPAAHVQVDGFDLLVLVGEDGGLKVPGAALVAGLVMAQGVLQDGKQSEAQAQTQSRQGTEVGQHPEDQIQRPPGGPGKGGQLPPLPGELALQRQAQGQGQADGPGKGQC